ncbi:hypothetical protein [Falsiphaeobacter marinintestinus]|uniref:hypothetical protein n=1 Tax=Falsiphaeobacter marinintestinus TaxID=1492905 RepID=UPI0011B749E9|nr:hypothetical protein [Phaeobacter marinintestinus]
MGKYIACTLFIPFLPERFRGLPLKKRFRAARLIWAQIDRAIQLALFATFSFFVVLFVFAFSKGCPSGSSCESSGFSYFWSASPNEVGDTLAGVAGSLAFLWLIVTVMLQGKELAAQRKELQLSRKESSRMATALEAQADVFRDEQRQRQEEREKLVLEQRLGLLRNFIETECENLGWWYVEEPNSIVPQLHPYPLFSRDSKLGELPTDEYFWKQFLEVKRQTEYLQSAEVEITPDKRPPSNLPLLLEALVNNVLELEGKLSEDQKERLEKIGLHGFSTNLKKLIKMHIWGEPEVIQP